MKRIILGMAAAVALLTFGQRPVLAAAMYTSPWCAVISLGPGSVYWDCQYRSVEECVPHVLAGNRGFCNYNPQYSGSEPVRHRQVARRKHPVPRN